MTKQGNATNTSRAPRRARPDIPDQEFYSLFSPWYGYGDFGYYYDAAKDHTLVSADRCYLLLLLARQAWRLEMGNQAS